MLSLIKQKLLALGVQVSEHSSPMVVYWDENMICRFANEAYADWFGLHPVSVVNKMNARQMLGALYQNHEPYIKGVIAGKVQIFERDITIVTGKVRRSVITYCPDFQNNKVRGIFVLIEDVSPSVTGTLAETNVPAKYTVENQLQAVVTTLKNSIQSNFPGISNLSKEHFISESTLKRAFKERFNSSVHAFYRNLQMEYADKLLAEKQYSKRQVAGILNFSNPSNFLTCYKKYVDEKATRQIIEDIKTESDERYQTFISQMPFAIAMFDNNMCFMAASQQWMLEYGLSGRNIIGVCCYTIFPNIESKWREIHQHCLQGNISHRDEDFFIRENGHACWMRWDIRPWYNHDKQVGGLIIYTEDITAIKLKEGESRKLFEVFERTSEIAMIGAWKRNYRTNTGIWNKITKQILEVPDDFKPDTEPAFHFYKEGESRDTIQNAFDAAINYGIPFDVEVDLITAKGNLKRVRVIGYPEFYSGRCERIFGIFQDVTSLKRHH